MSRTIEICYRDTLVGQPTAVEIPNPYYLLGTQDISMRFWSLPIWKEFGVRRLSQLGHIDPVFFTNWEMIDLLAQEIRLFHDNIRMIDFDAEVRAR